MKELNGQIGIIGNGSWGTAIAKILTDNGHKIHWWVRNEEARHQLETRLHNPHYLTSVRFLPGTIIPTDNLNSVVNACQTLIIAVPSAFTQQVLSRLPTDILAGKTIVSAIKGILPENNQLLNDYLASSFHMAMSQYVAITGPCHAEEVADERLSYLTFSGLNDDITKQVAAAFKNDVINTTCTHDLWGAQYAAVLKNIYAIGAGISHSLDYGDNFLSVFTTNCYREMYHFLQAHFEKVHQTTNQPDFHTSAYLGDLLVTCYSLHSRNRRFGAMIGKGYTVEAVCLEMNMVAEGYYASRGMQEVCKRFNIDLPIASGIHDILWGQANAGKTFKKIEKLLS